MKDGISGQAINLLSNDVARLDYMTFFINNVWNAPIGSFIAGYLIYTQIGYSGLIGLAILVFTMPIHSRR
jgi:ATP-binding cassette, subfamily C (CFTR/MRP), member 4